METLTAKLCGASCSARFDGRSGLATRLILSVAAAVLLTACPPPPPGAVYVATAPPAPREEALGLKPGAAYVWCKGYYGWDGTAYIWMPGGWQRPPRDGMEWVSGRWKHAGGGWFWVNGGWR